MVSADSRSISSSLGIGPAEQQQLPGDLRGAAGRAFGRHDQPGAILRARAVELFLQDALAGLAAAPSTMTGTSSAMSLCAGRGMDAEDAGVGEAPVEGIDRVAEPALLAHFLEQPRRHAAAEDHRKHLRGIEVAHMIGAALEAEDDLRVHQVAVLADSRRRHSAHIAAERAVGRGCGRRRAWLSTSRTKSSCLTSPAATDDHALGAVLPVQEGVQLPAR